MNPRCIVFITLFILLLLPQMQAWSQDRARIGLVLSGGGARGLAHIGVLKVLEEMRIPIDAIAATSMGAVVGGSYAAGLSAQRMASLVTSLNWLDLFTDDSPRGIRSNRRKRDDYKQLSRLSIGFRDGRLLFPPGVISGQRMELFLLELSKPARDIEDFDQLPIPFRAIATDLVNGQMVVFKSGQLDTAMRSSMSIPGVIAPFAAGETLLVDGGLVRNLPVEIARSMNVDHLIAVNLGTPLLKRDALDSVLGVTAQMIAILTEQNVQQSLARLRPGDVLISPQLGNITAADFARAAEAIEIGEDAARSVAKSLRRFSVTQRQYARWRERFAAPMSPIPAPVIDEIRIEKLTNVNPQRIKSLIRTQVGQPADEETLRQDVERIYGTGDFERVTYRFIEEQGRRVLAIEAFEKSWGPDYLRFGLGFSADFQGNTDLSFLTNYNRTWYNSSGAEWQSDLQLGTDQGIASEFYQPFSPTSQWFVAPYFAIQNRQIDIFSGSDKIARYDVGLAAFGVDLGVDLRDRGELRIGLKYALVDAEPNTGAADLPKIDAKQGALTASYAFDSLDNLNFPKSGSGLSADLYLARDFLGSDQSYSKLQGDWVSAFTLGKNTLITGAKLGARLDADTIPVYDEFVLGGFLQLSGHQNKQLRGQFMGLARLVFYREIANLAGNLGGTVYLGGSLETGNVWQDSKEIELSNLRVSSSVFLGADTLLGPLYLGYGVSDSGENSAYLFLGRP